MKNNNLASLSKSFSLHFCMWALLKGRFSGKRFAFLNTLILYVKKKQSFQLVYRLMDSSRCSNKCQANTPSMLAIVNILISSINQTSLSSLFNMKTMLQKFSASSHLLPMPKTCSPLGSQSTTNISITVFPFRSLEHLGDRI